MDEAIDELQFVSQSDNRATALLVLSQSQPLERAELEDRLEASHRTIVRVVNALSERGYLEESSEGLRLTPFGAHVADALDAFVDVTGTVREYRPLLSHAPAAVQDLDPAALAGAELVVATESGPFTVLDRMLDVRSESTRLREVAPAVERRSVEQLSRRVRSDEELDAEIVIPASAAEVARSRPEYREHFDTAAESDRVSVYVYPDSIDFAVGVADETAMVSVTRDEQPHALAISDEDALRTWAGDCFERYREAATPATEL